MDQHLPTITIQVENIYDMNVDKSLARKFDDLHRLYCFGEKEQLMGIPRLFSIHTQI